MHSNYIGRLKKHFLKLQKETSDLISAVDRSEYSHLQNYIFFAHKPIFSFTEAILILCKNKKSNAATVLLRTLLEVHINVIYHQIKDPEQRLAFSAKEVFDKRIVALKELLSIIKKYPNLESQDGAKFLNGKYLAKILVDQDEHRQAILRANPNLRGTSNFQEKARLCEEGMVKNSEPGSFELIYSLVYRPLSSFVHLNIEGLGAFMGQDEDGKVFFHEGDDEGLIASQAVGISIAFSKDLYDNEILVGEQIAIIQEIERFISQADAQSQYYSHLPLIS